MKNRMIALLFTAILLVMALAIAIQPAYGYGGVTSGAGMVNGPHGMPHVPNVPMMHGVPHVPSFHWPYSQVAAPQK